MHKLVSLLANCGHLVVMNNFFQALNCLGNREERNLCHGSHL